MKTSTNNISAVTKDSNHRNREGAILGIMVIIMLGVVILTLVLFMIARHSGREAVYAEKHAQAFWLAEAAVQMCRASADGGEISQRFSSTISGGTMEVIEDPDDELARRAIGTISYNGQTITRTIKFYPDFNLFDTPFYVGNGRDNTSEYTLHLLGEQDGSSMGPPTPVRNENVYGGNDVIEGDPEVNGNVLMQDDSSVVPDINGEFLGDLYLSGSVTMEDDSSVSGSTHTWQGNAAPNLSSMGYATNNSYNVSQIFEDAGIDSGRLPEDHELHDVLHVVKNPSDRSNECDSTPGDDFFFEQENYSDYVGDNSVDTAVSPLNLGEDVTYYVEGEVWFHAYGPYGFQIDGQAMIVSTADIHISDNLEYKDDTEGGDMLALVAMGALDPVTEDLDWNSADGDYNGGDIYFGDPEFGTLYICDAFMFANDDFLYNTSSSTGEQGEPESGFKVFGSFMAIDQIVLHRDWYTTADYDDGTAFRMQDDDGDWRWYDAGDGSRLNSDDRDSLENEVTRAAMYVEGQWVDLEAYEADGTKTVISGDYIRHYAMVAGYDDRITKAGDYISNLPQGDDRFNHEIFNWSEIK